MKSILIKLLVLAVCAAMLLSLFACNDTEDPTEAPTDEKTEAPTDEKTEAPTQKETEAPTQKETEAPTQKETEAPTQGSEAPTTDESESGEAPSESTSETTSEEKPTESETKPEEKPTESETKPEEKPTESETKPEEKPTESETKPEEKPTEPEKPTCDGNHPYKDRGDQGHYQDACEICGIERVLEAHTYEIKDGKPTCSVCNYVASCQGVHAWETDAEGHWTNKCLVCEAEAIEKAAHTGAPVEGKYICTVCKIELPCPETHKVHGDAEGHWTEACAVCGAEAVEKTAHDDYEEIAAEGKYAYRCTTCGVELKTITLTDGVEVFYSAYNMSKPEASATPDKLTPNTHANMDNKAFKFEEGIPYFTFTGQDKAFQLIWMRDTGSASTHEKYQVDMGQAKYMVIKARGTENAINNVRVYFNTAGSTADVAKFKLPLNAAGAEEWGVYVIDMSTVLSANYAKSDDTYKLDCFYICSNTNLATTDRIDIGYVAFVDELTDIDSIVDEETVYNVTSTGGAYSSAEEPEQPSEEPEQPTDAPEQPSEEPAVVVEDLSEINDMADGTKVQISGTVTAINAGWNETTRYMSVYITDAFGESILCYKLETKVVKGDIITVTGKVTSYNEVKQIAAGATAVVTDHDTSYDVVITEVTIAEALELADGTDVIVTGTVIKINTAWNDSYGNISVTIKDEAGNELDIYRLGTQVEFGDIIKVTGTMATHNDRQIGEGATAEIVGTHECTEFTDATCTAAPECVFCGAVNGEALGHNYVDGSCTVCGSKQPAAGQVTASKNIADLITSEGWTNTTTKQSFNLDDNVTVKVDGGSNSGKAYNGDHIRIYATDSPAGSLTISVAAGYELVSVTISTKTGTYAFITVDGATDISNTETAVSGSSVVLTSVKNGDEGRQVQVTAIEVVYAPIA